MIRPTSVLTVDPQAGTTVAVAGNTYRMLVIGEQTDNQFAVIDMLVPPGGGPSPHAYAEMAESFYVVDGEVVVYSETQTYTARKGAFITIPTGGAVHMFKNESDQLAHLLCIVVPAGLEAMFLALGQPVDTSASIPSPPMTPTQMQAQMQALGEQYGQEFFPPDYFKK